MSFKKMLFTIALGVFLAAQPAMAAIPGNLPDFTGIVSEEGRAVVHISTTQTIREAVGGVPEQLQGDPFFEFFKRFAPPQLRERKVGSLGSGFIISPDGYVLTNAHVVARADQITVSLTDKREFKARLVGSDARTDIALLKIQADRLPVVRLGRSADLKVGEWVLAIGSPFGFDNTVTSGIVSALNRLLPDETYTPFIQTDAAVNPGNSGGPLFNLKGEVVGINSQIFSQSGGFMGISFAIPIDTAMEITAQLKAKGKVSRSMIGVMIQDMSRELAASFGLSSPAGALISQVGQGGPAMKAGLRSGDVVLKVNATPVNTGADLQRAVTALPPGSRLTVELWRDNARKTLTLVTEELKEEDPRLAAREYRGRQDPGAREDPAANRLGLVVGELSPQQLSRLGIRYGLVVRGVRGLAAKAGLTAGDVIIGVGARDLTSLKDWDAAVSHAQKAGALALKVQRQGQTLFLALPMTEKEE
ncbi:DegQ family serine endoprotease [Paludibacterium paludis]|uniref:Probable periplasmic serine endoprotease DegP-like n=1 Tax=Paludibacterium paludis TaxID=1225769 RepID=A0A918NYI4_9NEIS|nr:DegQ family serine endoprotease [Paludibacterium paludis]GGY06391.1 serine peptidase [Paludibacterium paludis]